MCEPGLHKQLAFKFILNKKSEVHDCINNLAQELCF